MNGAIISYQKLSAKPYSPPCRASYAAGEPGGKGVSPEGVFSEVSPALLRKRMNTYVTCIPRVAKLQETVCVNPALREFRIAVVERTFLRKPCGSPTETLRKQEFLRDREVKFFSEILAAQETV